MSQPKSSSQSPAPEMEREFFAAAILSPIEKRLAVPVRKLESKSIPSLDSLFNEMSHTIAIRHEASTTEKYDSSIRRYLDFLKQYNFPGPYLPLNAEHVQLWFTFLRKTTNNQYAAYKVHLAALRKWSRDNGFRDLNELETDLRKSNQSRFATFIEGLKKQLPIGLPKQAKAFSKDLLSDLLKYISDTEEIELVKNRDVAVLSVMFVGALRACDLAKINVDQVVFSVELISRDFDVHLFGGKMNKKMMGKITVHGEGHSIDIFGYMKKYHAIVTELYEMGTLTPDKFGRKLFVNIHQKTFEVANQRIDHKVVTKILRQRLGQFFKFKNQDLSEEQIEVVLKDYSSHSLKRGLATHAIDSGASDTQVTKAGRWSNVQTMGKYVDPSVMKNSLQKTIKL